MESSSTETTDPIIGPLDSKTGYPSVTSEEVKKFAQMRKYAYDKLMDEERTLSCEGVSFKAKGFCITPRTAQKLKPHVLPIEDISGVQFRLPKDFHHLLSHTVHRMEEEPSGIIGDPATELTSWLQYLCIYGEDFSNFYDKYCADPDSDVIFEEELISTTTISKHESTLTQEDVKASLHLILLCMNKTFQGDTHVNTFIQKRLRAVNETLQVASTKLFYHNHFLMEVSTALKDLPKLKTTLYWFCYTNKDKYLELDQAIRLQAKRGMKTIDEAFSFTEAFRKSLAHKNPIIIEESNRFMEQMVKKRNDAGQMWPYWKLLYPDDSSISMSQYPNLTAAALFYRKARNPTFANYEVWIRSFDIPNLEELCATEDEESIPTLPCFTRAELQNPDLNLAAEYLGFDLSKAKIVD